MRRFRASLRETPAPVLGGGAAAEERGETVFPRRGFRKRHGETAGEHEKTDASQERSRLEILS
jgi:hypothetical protein